MQRYQPIPLVQPGGMQPYQGSTPQVPGAALLAMLKGATAQGVNPVDPWRAMQKQAGQRQRTLLDQLAS